MISLYNQTRKFQMKTVIDVSHSTALAGSRHRGAQHSLSDNVQNKETGGRKAGS